MLISYVQYQAFQQFERYAPTPLFADEIPENTLEQFGTIPLSPEGDQFDTEISTAE